MLRTKSPNTVFQIAGFFFLLLSTLVSWNNVAGCARAQEAVESAQSLQEQADTAFFARKDYRSSLELYLRARVRDTSPERLAARRKQTEMIVRCATALGEYERSASEFYILSRSDPAGCPLEILPLPWHLPPGKRAALERLAAEQLQQRETPGPAGTLLAATTLYFGSDPRQRSQGEKYLRALLGTDEGENLSPALRHRKTQITRLATAVLWKGTPLLGTTNVIERDIRSREKLIAALDEPLRAGPYLFFAETYYRLGRYDDVVIAAMRSATLAPDNRPQTAAGLLIAARALQKLERRDQCETLCREVVRDYADFDWVLKEAESLLKSENTHDTNIRLLDR